MAVGLGLNGAILGVGEETEWGTAVAPTKFIAINSDGLGVEDEHVYTESINATYSRIDEVIQGNRKCGGDIAFDWRYEGFELFLKHALGSVTTTEQTSFTVSATNKFIDFNIGSTELTATIAEGTYIMGATQATTASLCKAIYDAIVAAEAVGVYTVAFSNVTKKITITRSTGSFAILWKTGTHGADGLGTSIATLLGYATTADDTSALTYTSDTAVVTVFSHAFTIADSLPTGLTIEKQLDGAIANMKGFTYAGAKVSSLDFTVEPGGISKGSVNFIAKDETAITGSLTSATLPTAGFITGIQAAVTLNSTAVTTKCTALSFTLDNKLKDDRYALGARLVYEPVRQEKIDVTGSMTLEFQSETEYNFFNSFTTVDAVVTLTGALIKSGHSQTLTVNLNDLKLTGSTPKSTESGLIYVEFPFKAHATDSSTREISMTLKNTVASF